MFFSGVQCTEGEGAQGEQSREGRGGGAGQAAPPARPGQHCPPPRLAGPSRQARRAARLPKPRAMNERQERPKRSAGAKHGGCAAAGRSQAGRLAAARRSSEAAGAGGAGRGNRPAPPAARCHALRSQPTCLGGPQGAGAGQGAARQRAAKGQPRAARGRGPGRPPTQGTLGLRQSGRYGPTQRGRRWSCCSSCSPPAQQPAWWGSARCQSPCRRRRGTLQAGAGQPGGPWGSQWQGGRVPSGPPCAAAEARSPGSTQAGSTPWRQLAVLPRRQPPCNGSLQACNRRQQSLGQGARSGAQQLCWDAGGTGNPSWAPAGERHARGGRQAFLCKNKDFVAGARTHRERPRLSNTTSARSISPHGVNASFSCCHVQSQGKLWTTTYEGGEGNGQARRQGSKATSGGRAQRAGLHS